MSKRTLVLVSVLLLAAAPGRAQSRFRDLTPGVSTRDEVARALGAPVRNVSKSLVEYPAPEGMARVEVEFDNAGVAQRIEVHLDPPVTRRALSASYGLSGSDARKARGGKLVEYFAGEALVSFTYGSEAEASGVASVGHFSRRAFSAASGVAMPEPWGGPGGDDAGARKTTKGEKALAVLGGVAQVLGAVQQLRQGQAGWSVGNQATLEGIYLSQYPAASAERCQADCGGNGACRAYVFVRAGNPNPGDPSMCYLMSSATRAVQSPCCVAGVKGGGQ
ncbi:MAG: PAN domain-containing protein [Vicinamibacterales bacterium]